MKYDFASANDKIKSILFEDDVLCDLKTAECQALGRYTKLLEDWEAALTRAQASGNAPMVALCKARIWFLRRKIARLQSQVDKTFS